MVTGSGAPVIDRADPSDRAVLAMDRGGVREQLAVVLLLRHTRRLDQAQLRDALAERVATVPRLRQKLVRAPVGGGGPLWVDDGDVDLGRHIREHPCQPPGDAQALWQTALEVTAEPLPRGRPMWAIVHVTGLRAPQTSAVVLVLHHAIADGMSGLGILQSLLDPVEGNQGGAPAGPFPRPKPTAAQLRADAWGRRAAALRRSWGAARQAHHAMSVAGGMRPVAAAPCSLLSPTGPRWRIAVVQVARPPVREAAHRRGATTNDAVLTTVVGALAELLTRRGETVDPLLVAVPVSTRRLDHEATSGNRVTLLVVPVPTRGSLELRLVRTAAEVARRKSGATGPAPVAALGWLFRPLAAAGVWRWYLRRQRRFHTLVSHVRGPSHPVTLAGCPIEVAVPISVGGLGNVAVYAEVLSYAGDLTISLIADADLVPDLDAAAAALRVECGRLLSM